MPQIKPITELRNTTEISDLCHAQREPIFITKNGYGDLVIMSMETYDEMLGTVQVDKAIFEAESMFQADKKLIPAEEGLSLLRRKYFG